MKLSDKDEKQLLQVHPLLVKLVRRVAERGVVTFKVLEGARTLEKQKKLLAAKATTTLRSRHIPSGDPAVAHAVDLGVLVGGVVRWDWPLYNTLAKEVKSQASLLSIPLEWGGDWTSFKDGPHYQLPWRDFP